MAEEPREDLKAAKKAAAVLKKIGKMPAPFGGMGERLHALILRTAPTLQPNWRWGMPWYKKDGKDICFFRVDKKYLTFGLSEDANVPSDGNAPDQLLPSAWFLATLDDATEDRLGEIIRIAAS